MNKTILNKEEVENLLNQGFGWMEMERRFNVNHVLIAKFAKRHGLKLKHREVMKEKIEKLLKKDYSISQISQELNITKTYVRKCIRIFGLKYLLKQEREKIELKNHIQKCIEKEFTNNQIMEFLKIGFCKLHSLFVEMGVKTRRKRHQNALKDRVG